MYTNILFVENKLINLKPKGPNINIIFYMNIDLSNFNKNIYSQFREDGIIEEILSKLQDNCKSECCEFSAWDGTHLSNTYNLILNKNYNALLIEPNKKRLKKLNFLNDRSNNKIR